MKLKGRHFKTLADFSKEEIEYLINLSAEIKILMKEKNSFRPMEGYSMAMIFQKRSTRTRVSTETGISYMGGHALFLGIDDIQLGKNETLKDTAKVLSRFNDLILARVYAHDDIDELARYSESPVINALSDKYHPLQILADLLTIKEHFGTLKGLTLAWVGDGNNVLHSLLVACPKLGINIQVATPKGYEPDADVVNLANTFTRDSSVFLTNDPREAVNGANIIVTDTWISMGQDEEYEKRIKAFKGYQVSFEMAELAAENWKFMHCLPRKEHEVNDEVFYSDRSIVFDEAENRMYTVMAVSLSLLGLDEISS